MEHWLALLPTLSPNSPPENGLPLPAMPAEAQRALGWWALQFTPRVCLVEEAVLLEVEASLRLFGGAEALRERVAAEAGELGCSLRAWAPTALAALALARSGQADGLSRPLASILDAVPLGSLSAAAEHEPLLARLGCRRLGELRRLPREGLSRRFGAGLLAAMDQAYGLRPSAHAWLALPEVFEARVELPGRVESAPALMFAARRLLLQMCGWLAARQAGMRRFVLGWRHDFHRAGTEGAGELEVRTAETTRDAEHLSRLLGELLARVRLAAPVGEITLRCDEAEPLVLANRLLLPGPDELREGESLPQLLERLSARLGADQVLRPVLRQDHRPQCRQAWYPATQEKPPQPRWPEHEELRWPEPSWVLPEPRPLAVRRDRPFYRGPLELLSGPHRIEAGWWDTSRQPEAARDYFVAFNQRAGLLWIYRQQQPRSEQPGSIAEGGWFLQGIFG